jgi:hypothetical protein
MSPAAPTARANKTRMDVISSDVYAPEKYDSDDSLPDLAQSFGLPSKFPTKRNTDLVQNNHTQRDESRVLVSSRETMTRINRESMEENTLTGMAQMKAYMQQNLSKPSRDPLTRSTSTMATSGANKQPPPLPPALQMFLDPISSSSPLPSLVTRPITTNRTPSFTRGLMDIEPIISSSPPVTQGPTGQRHSLHRANTFHTLPSDPIPMNRQSRSQPSHYHDISDDDEDLRAAILASQNSIENNYDEEEALKAAIAASLAEVTPKARIPPEAPRRPVEAPRRPVPSQSQMRAPPRNKTTVFQSPDEFFGPVPSSPPEVQVLEVELEDREVQVSQREIYRTVQREPRSSPPSSQIRHDTKRMLDALDDTALNALKRKNEEDSVQSKKKVSKKAGVENAENPKPRKRAALTQEEKVHPNSRERLTLGFQGSSPIR